MDPNSSQPNMYAPQPTYTQKLNLLNTNPQLPQIVDLNTVDPAYRPYYAAYNDSITNSGNQVTQLKNQAQMGQTDVGNAYKASIQGAKNAYQTNLTGIQSANQDAQLSNRMRARAVGGAPSSGFLDLANRTDIQSQRDIGKAGQDLGQNYAQADLVANQALTRIIGDLNSAILGIQNNANLSLRERDNAIADAKARAAAAAQQAAYLASLNGVNNNTGGTDVLGAQTQATDTYDTGNTDALGGAGSDQMTQSIANPNYPTITPTGAITRTNNPFDRTPLGILFNGTFR